MGPARKLPYSKGMSLGFPARWTVVCTIVCASGAVRAEDAPTDTERRRVAIIDLSDDPGADSLRDDLYTELTRQPALTTTENRAFDSVLVGKFIDEDERHLQEAATRKSAAEAALLQFQYPDAAEAASAGLRALTEVSPVKAAPLAADLAFYNGWAELFRKHAGEAGVAFAFVHRLDPARKLDPFRIDPDVVTAFAKAQSAKTGKHKLEVLGKGEVWIDGVSAGPAPASVEVDDGQHLVQLTGPEREVRGAIELVQKDQRVDIADAPAAADLLVARARVALRDTPEDAVARAPVMKHMAELLDVHDAVLVWRSASGKLLVETWRDRAPGFSTPREYLKGDPVPPLLEPLAPPKPKIEIHDTFRPPQPPFTPPHPIEAEPPWYRKTWVQASVAGGVIAAVVGGILWARHTSHISVGQNPQWDGM
jgi:hypothetical protein